MDTPPITPGLTDAVVAIRALFSAAATSTAVIAEDGEHLRFVAADGAGADKIVGVELPVGRGIAGFVAMSGQAMAVADVRRDPRFAREVAESTAYVPRAIVAVPILSPDGEVAGVLSVLDPAVEATSGWALSVLGTLGMMLGGLLERPTADDAAGQQPHLRDAVARVSAHGAAGERLAADVLAAVAAFLDESAR